MSATVTALRLFDGWKGKEDLVRVYIEAGAEFTADEMKAYTETFIKFDVNKSGDLDEFELNKMYEARGETKTSAELKELIRSVGDEFSVGLRVSGVTLKAFYSILLKDKKGMSKTSWGSFAAIAKKHDSAKATGNWDPELMKDGVEGSTQHTQCNTTIGRIANTFEQKAAEGNAEELRIKADIELRKASREIKKQEQESKAKKAAALARFQANLNGTPVPESSTSSAPAKTPSNVPSGGSVTQSCSVAGCNGISFKRGYCAPHAREFQ